MIAYFGLKRQPFSKEIKTSNFLESYDVKEAMARLGYIRQNRGIMMLTGEPGSGKTSVLRKFVDSLNPQTHLHYYNQHATVKGTELYRQLSLLFKLPNRIYKSILFHQIQRSILDWYEHQGKTPCMILDECHLMDSATLQEIVLITNFHMDSRVPFIMLLCGQPDLKEKLKRRMHEPLNQRISLRYHMSGLTQEETRNYVLHHLKIVGRNDPLFDEPAFEIIHQSTMGLPRKIGNLCLAAMTLAMLRQKSIIDADLVYQATSGI